VSERTYTAALVNRKSVPWRAWRWDVQSDVGRTFPWFVGREADPASFFIGTTGAIGWRGKSSKFLIQPGRENRPGFFIFARHPAFHGGQARVGWPKGQI
jgi:hypothetical protein